MTLITLALSVVLLTACGRPLTSGEQAFAATLFGDELDHKPVRIAPFTALSSLTAQRPKRPRVACRERIFPASESTSDMVTSFTAAFVTFNRLNMARAFYLPDYMSKYPEKMSLPAAMLFGHELTHVWQWQNRGRTGFSPLKAVSEHHPGQDPYLLELDAQAQFLDFPFEQQGAIVEEYVCCRQLDPKGARTLRLHAMLSAAMPVATIDASLPRPEVILPWKGAVTKGICS